MEPIRTGLSVGQRPQDADGHGLARVGHGKGYPSLGCALLNEVRVCLTPEVTPHKIVDVSRFEIVGYVVSTGTRCDRSTSA